MGTKYKMSKSYKKKEDWKYKAVLGINISEVVFVLGVLYLAANYSWWLLLFILLTGSSDAERRILGLPERD